MVTEEQREQVSSYLKAQAAKLSIDDLLRKRSAEVENLLTSAAGLEADEASWAPKGEWDALQILQHVLESFATYRRVISRTAAGIDGGDQPPQPPAVTVPVLLQSIRAENEKTHAMVRTFGDAPPARTEPSQFGHLNWREWLLFERVHILDHVNQLRALKQRLDTPGR